MQNNKLFITLLLIIVSIPTFAQRTTNSPYSKYGIGLLRQKTFTRSFGMGGTGIGLRSNREIGFINPASYSAVVVTTFDVGYSANTLWLKDGSESQTQRDSYIDHISFAFPMIKNTWGMSFGFLPHSNVGYEYTQIVENTAAGTISVFEKGVGALNKAYFGNGFAINIDSTSLISFGANAYYIFGTTNYDKRILYGELSDAYNVLKTDDIKASGLGYDVGLQYQKTIEQIDKDPLIITLGATYGLAADINTKTIEEQLTFSGTNENPLDEDIEAVVYSNLDVEGVLQLPSEIGFGFSLERKHKWIFALDYKTADWGSIVSNDNLFNYKSNSSLNSGIQYIPEHDANGSYLKRMAYRLGVRYSDSYVSINNTDWNEYGITFGLGLPVRRSASSYPRLNFGIEYGKRGKTDSGLIEEKFLNFNVGLTINATWFRKRRYD